MPTKEDLNTFAQHIASVPPPRPQLINHHSSSVPSTPLAHSRKLSFGARTPSPDNLTGKRSPQSARSATENGLHTRGKAQSFTGCKYETGMAFSRRRIPYSMGGDQLERAKAMPKKFLTPEEEGKLSGDMGELYNQILPSKESDERRAGFVQKLEKILNHQWPGNDIKVRVFGSSGNMLCTSDSDVDICVTTPMKELERVCLLAEALADHGMQRVVCVPHAKVPIVKFWDAELELACDMNVNNTLALENTRMIKTYVEIDERVRPLAMIVKHWTKRRILNDAALGGTLSSYTWICMILNFLQTRNPPILPSLHRRGHLRKKGTDGRGTGFNDDIDRLRGFGHENKETTGELLFQFFRRYAHDLDFEKNVVSVREGRLISKEAKKWHLMQNNRLCVEEPFNTERNLGNTADDISFRGIHLELRRAFDLVSEAKLAECLEKYEFPALEEKIWEKPPPKPPPVLSRVRSQSQSSRAAKGGNGNRGGRHNQHHRPSSRRASSATAMNKFPAPHLGVQGLGGRDTLPRDHSLQAQYDQLRLHHDLFNKYQYLQAQEHELRLLQAQAQLHAQMQMQGANDRSTSQSHPPRDEQHRVAVTSQVPSSAPLRGGQYFHPFAYPQVPGTPYQSFHTQPSSPSMRPAQPALRRSVHRTSGTDSNSTSLRSHSQPARPVPMTVAMQNAPALPLNSASFLQYQHLRQQQLYDALEMAHGAYGHAEVPQYHDPRRQPMDPAFDESVPKEYVGYWVNDSPPSRPYRDDTMMSRLPTFQDLHPRVRGVPQSLNRLRNNSRSPSPSPAIPFRDRSYSIRSASSAPIAASRNERPQSNAQNLRSGPVIVNSSETWALPEYPPMGDSASLTTTMSEATSISDEQLYETPVTADMDTPCNGQGFEDAFVLDNPQKLFHAHTTADLARDPASYGNGNVDASSHRLSNQVDDTATPPGTGKRSEKPHKIAGGLGIQFGEVEMKRTSPRAEENARQAAGASKADPKPITPTNSQFEKPLMPTSLLSPVREVRTPSPIGKRREDVGSDSPHVTGSIGSKMDLYIPPFAELVRAKQAKQTGALLQKPNGMLPSPKLAETTKASPPLPTHKSISPPVNVKAHMQHPQINGWQQQSTKKNKKNKSRPSSGQYVTGEPLPATEAERKGG